MPTTISTSTHSGAYSYNYNAYINQGGANNILASTVNDIIAIDTLEEIASVEFNNPDIKVLLHTNENGVKLKLKFAPDADMTALESARLTLLWIMCSNPRMVKSDDIITYIRHHGLMRHFQIIP